MTSISLELPESLRQVAQELAERDNVSLDHFVALAVAEKVSALKTIDFVAEKVNQDARAILKEVLSHVPDVEPEEYDKL